MKKHIEIIERMMFAMANHTVDGKRIYPTLKAAKDALEKQTPKKLRYEVDNRYGVRNIYYFCPSCNSFRMESKKCCSNCGQALDWEETFRELCLTRAVENLADILAEGNTQ